METSNKNLSPAEQAVLNEAHKVNEERMQAVKDLAAIVAQRIDLEERLTRVRVINQLLNTGDTS